MEAQIRPFGQKLLEQPIGVLATAQLPGTVRIAEVHPDARGPGQLPMAWHFLALIVGKRLAPGLGHLIELGREDRQSRLCGRIGHLAQQHKAGAAHDQHAGCWRP